MESREAKKQFSIFNFQFSIISLCVLLWIVVRYQETLQRLHPEWILAVLGLGILWCLRHILYLPLLLLIFLCCLLLYHWFIALPSGVNRLQKEISPHKTVLINAKIQERAIQKKSVRLHLTSVEILTKKHRQLFPEAILTFPKNRLRSSGFYRGRLLQVNGPLKSVGIENNRLHLTLLEIRYRDAIPPETLLSRTRNSWVLRLLNRAEFYLSNQALALYLPLTLAKRSYGSRSTVRIFRESGMAHLLAISGLHIGLIYGLFLLPLTWVRRFSIYFLENPYYHKICHGIALAGIWIYLLLIGSPTPAFRAVCMLTLLVTGLLFGQAHNPLYALFATALFFVFLNPAVIYEISFQLSFLAVLYILWFSPFYFLYNSNAVFWKRLGKYALFSIGMTTAVMLGTWPVVAATFGQLTLETFWLNLVLVPLLGIFVLPCCLLALAVSMFSLGSPPFGILESSIFALTELIVRGWFQVLATLHQWGSPASFPLTLEWGVPQFLAYYGGTLSVGKLSVDWFRKSNRF